MLQKLKREQKGFTIVEVMIVLVIAGLILLIVFLAIPALQRNSRNTQRKHDVASYLAGAAEWSNNNAGKVPATADLGATNGVNSLSKLGFYTAPTTVVTGAQTAAVSVNTLQFVTAAKCSTTTLGNTIAGPTRAIAVRYAVENATGGAVAQCQES